jgi:hypothetical protein
MLAYRVSRTEEANVTMGVVSLAATTEQPTECGLKPAGAPTLDDESVRARLIADIGRLIRHPSVPENTRLAGLTLIGWLARRRPEEAPHAIGVDEARKSERCLQAARAKAR